MSEDEKTKPDGIIAFFCPGGDKGPACRCSCPDSCEHVWDGPTWTSDDGRAQSATCSRCGMVQMDHDMWVLP